MITECAGIPLAFSLTGGNRNDVTQLIPLIEAIPPVHEAFMTLACAIIRYRRPVR